MAGMSCISSDCEPGASVRIARVLSRIRSAMPAPIGGIVIGRLDAERPQHLLGETARRKIGGVRHQQMLAALHRRLQRHRDGGEAGRRQRRAGRAGDFAPGVGERVGGRRAVRAIGVALIVGLHRSGVGIKHGRAAKRRQVDEAVRGLKIVAGVDQPGAEALRCLWFIHLGRRIGRRSASGARTALSTGAREAGAKRRGASASTPTSCGCDVGVDADAPDADLARDKPGHDGSAAQLASRKLSAVARSTETIWLTPRSGMVTPNRRSMRAIVTGLWVMVTKRVSARLRISSSRSQKRSTL